MRRFTQGKPPCPRDQKSDAPPTPFCLIISLVNPHDVLSYPNADSFKNAGYGEVEGDNKWLAGNVDIPKTFEDV